MLRTDDSDSKFKDEWFLTKTNFHLDILPKSVVNFGQNMSMQGYHFEWMSTDEMKTSFASVKLACSKINFELLIITFHTFSAFFFNLTSSSLRGIVPPSQPITNVTLFTHRVSNEIIKVNSK